MMEFEFRRFLLGVILVLNFIPSLIHNGLEQIIEYLDKYELEEEKEES